jgi:hypothetical protein
MSDQTIFTAIPDPLYTLSGEKVPVNGDTITRKTIEVAPNTSALASIAVPLNASSGTRYQFQVPFDGYKVRWGNLALRLKMVMCCVNGTNVTDLPSYDPDTATNPYDTNSNYYDAFYGIDPFAIFAMFGQVVLKLNNQTVLYQSTSETVIHDCASRIMSEYSFDAVNNTLSDCIFGPMGDKTYTIARTTTATENTYAPYVGGNVTCSPYITYNSQSCLSRPVAAVVSTSTSVVTSGPPVTVATTTTSVTSPIVESNPYACDPCLKKRVENWTMPVGSASRVITRVIPFNVLFPRLPDLVFNNINRLFVELTFSNKARSLLVPFTTRSSVTGLGAGISIIEMQLLLDSHEMAPNQSISSTVSSVVEGKPDIIAMPYVQTYIRDWTPGSEVQISGISNFQSLFVCAPTDGINNGAWITSLGGSPTQTQLDVLGGSFTNTFSQWLPFSSVVSKFAPTLAAFSTYTNAQAPIVGLKYDIMAKRARDCLTPLNTIQILWGRHNFPQNALITSDNQGINGLYTWNGSQLYYEHAKAQDRVCSRVFSSAIPDDVFNTTMPHVLFNPNASGAPTLNNKDSVIRVLIRGGTTTYVPNLIFTITSLKLLKILPSGEIMFVE